MSERAHAPEAGPAGIPENGWRRPSPSTTTPAPSGRLAMPRGPPQPRPPSVPPEGESPPNASTLAFAVAARVAASAAVPTLPSTAAPTTDRPSGESAIADQAPDGSR